MKEVIWHHKAKEEVREFPKDVRYELGGLLYRLQKGDLLVLPHSRKMSSVGKGVHELRIKGEDGIYRVFYLLKVEDKVLVLYGFQKKTQKTSQKDINKGQKRLKEIF